MRSARPLLARQSQLLEAAQAPARERFLLGHEQTPELETELSAAPAMTGRSAAAMAGDARSDLSRAAARTSVKSGSMARRVITRLTCIMPRAEFSVRNPKVKTAARRAVDRNWVEEVIGWNGTNLKQQISRNPHTEEILNCDKVRIDQCIPSCLLVLVHTTDVAYQSRM